MGQELECTMHYQERSLAGKAYLEGDFVLFRGDERLKVSFKDIKTASASGGVLRLDFEGGPAEFDLGAAAEKWAYKILNPPSRLHKLGVKAGMGVRLIGRFEESFLKELHECRIEESDETPDLIFFAVEAKGSLNRVENLSKSMKRDGGLWIIYPKAVATVREIDVIQAGRRAHLKDVKVASFSISHTGLKFMLPLAARKK